MFLSNEVLLMIFQHFNDAQSVIRLGATCTRLAAMARDATIWERLVRSHFPLVVKFVACTSKQDGTHRGVSSAVLSPAEEPSNNDESSLWYWPIKRVLIGEDEDAVKFSTWRAAYRQCCRSAMTIFCSGT